MLALDRSVRTMDRDGRLHVALTNISKANVCPYLGKEIPEAEKLGLDPDRVYKLLRDPAELEKAAATSNNIQLLSEHKPVTAKEPNERLVAGSTGTDGQYEHPYLKNSLVVWRKVDIDDIESREKCELSSGYHYRADMTPGVWEGEPYDGVMRDIVFNHVALVVEGRAGPDVIVQDSIEGLRTMPASAKTLARRSVTVGALVSYLRPRLAADAKIDLSAILGDVTPKQFRAKRPTIAAAIEAATKDKLAKDATIKDMTSLLDSLEKLEDEDAVDESVSPEEHKAMEAAAHGASTLGIPEKVGKEFAKKDDAKDDDIEDVDDAMDWARDWMMGKGMSEDDVAEFEEIRKKGGKKEDAAEDEPPPFKDMPKANVPKAKDRRAKDALPKAKDAPKEEDKKDMVTKGAMDKAIEDSGKRILTQQREARAAERVVRPWVGELAIACDSAPEVFRAALKMLNIKDVDKLHDTALEPVLRAQPLPSKNPRPLASDSAPSKGLAERVPGLERIGHV